MEVLTKDQHQVDECRDLKHEIEIEYDRELTKIQQVKARIVREQERLETLQLRLEDLVLCCSKLENPGLSFQEDLTHLLKKHQEVDSSLKINRDELAQLKINSLDLEKTKSEHDLEIKNLQKMIEEIKLQEQALIVRAASVQELLDDSGLQAQTLLEHIALGVTQRQREDDLIALCEKIEALGAINLAAIEEFNAEQERKNYLEEQYHDLTQALETLKTAIEKIDKESISRLENTFDEVNTSFKALFPRLFGGGKAQLELTCENLLEAGIVVMAQPPGKRNSTIHLLSGGEKAMTAVALVFAIFQLNPSPFCMLDEVDAPLDDINVGRFCDLVKEMSQFVQFLFITHNKVTMELADHLIGVTMREPGVSRLVTVDVINTVV